MMLMKKKMSPSRLLYPFLLLLCLFLSPSVHVVVVSGQSITGTTTCACKSIDKSFVVTRLWNIIDPEWTDEMVIAEFDRGFAPHVTHLPGFQEYTSATTNVANTVFFMNIFEDRNDAKAAQEGAKEFVQKGVLDGVITPNQFTENDMIFHVASQDCITQALGGKALGTQLWTLTGSTAATTSSSGNSTSSATASTTSTAPPSTADIGQMFLEELVPQVQAMEGFLEYGGGLVSGTDLLFFYVVFQDLSSVTKANFMADEFAATKEDQVISLIVSTEGIVDFDYTCAAGNIPAPFPEGHDFGIPADAADGTTDSITSDAKPTTTTSALWLVGLRLSILTFFFF